MDAGEIAELAASLEKALADGLVAAGATKEERVAADKKAEAESAEARRIAEKRSDALHRVIDSFERGRKNARSAAADAVAGYCGKARAEVLEFLKKDSRMPRAINYLERYGALVGADDRFAVLERLDATLDLAEEILDTAAGVDVRGAFAEGAAKYAQKVMRLDGIRIAEAVCVPKGEEPGAGLSGSVASTPSEVVRAIEDAFAGVLGELPEIEWRKAEEVEAAKSREKAVDEQIDAAVRAAGATADAIMRLRAESVAGAVFAVSQPMAFDGEVVLKAAKDSARVRELAAEVRKSFGTFKQVVADNGLFAAFANDGAYGACRGVSFDWWWEGFFDDEYFGEKPGSKVYDDILTSVEEDEGGDSLEKSIERMKKLNERKYWGLLDDDFAQHVNAFWYGFKKLMENVNSLFDLDSRAFDKYCGQISQTMQSSAGELAEHMDGPQLSAFCKEINDRGRIR